MAKPVLLGRGGRLDRRATVTNYPLVGTFSDDFATQDTGKWNGYYGTNWPVVSGGQLSIPVVNTYNFVQSVGTYKLTGSAVSLKAVSMPNVGDGTIGAYFQVVADANNLISLQWQNGNLNCSYTVAGVANDLNITYSATTHAWWRIREAGGTIYWDTSADGITWTNRRSVTAPFSTASVAVKIMAGFYGTNATPGAFVVDNVNTTGTAAAPTYVADYQTADFSQYQALDKDTSVSQASRFAIVTTPARSGFPDTARFTLLATDNDPFNDPNCNRTEAVINNANCGNPVVGDEQWWAFSVYFPTTFTTVNVPWLLYHEYHHTNITGNPNVAFFLSSGTANPTLSINFWGGAFPAQEFNYNTGSLGAIPKGIWVDHLIYVKWHTDPAQGRFGFWMNGVQKVAPTTAMANMYTGTRHQYYGTGPNSIYMEQGLYKGKQAGAPDLIAYFTGTRWGPTRASVELL